MTAQSLPRNELWPEIEEIIRGNSLVGLLTSKTIYEEAVGDCLCSLFRERGYRTAARVNRAKLMDDLPRESRTPISVLQSYKHPLQPDVDLLVEDSSQCLWGNELKLIRWADRRLKPVIPRDRLYSGLGQALGVATLGVDYASLWHVFVHPIGAYRNLEARDQAHGEQIDDRRAEIVASYTGINLGILERFGLPIGYIAVLLISDQATRSVSLEPLLPWRKPTRLEPSPTGDRVRSLLLRALDFTNRNSPKHVRKFAVLARRPD